jgi:predicted pyridoxine 5'-phosphate oxidase superfamily flavin-nucleotide-binding protein
MDYLVWYDENKQKTATEKIQEAIAAYIARFTVAPDLVLVSAADEAEVSGVLIRSHRTVQPNNFWVGMQEEE